MWPSGNKFDLYATAAAVETVVSPSAPLEGQIGDDPPSAHLHPLVCLPGKSALLIQVKFRGEG